MSAVAKLKRSAVGTPLFSEQCELCVRGSQVKATCGAIAVLDVMWMLPAAA